MRKLKSVVVALILVAPPVSAADLDCDGETVATIQANDFEYEVEVRPNCMGALTAGWLLAAVTRELVAQILLDQPYENRAFVFDLVMDEFIHTLKMDY